MCYHLSMIVDLAQRDSVYVHFLFFIFKSADRREKTPDHWHVPYSYTLSDMIFNTILSCFPDTSIIFELNS